jgi:hypothetical protein
MSSRSAIIDERVRQLRGALAEAKQEATSAGNAASQNLAAAREWETRARAAEEWIQRLERDIRVGLIRSVDEVGDLAHAYRPPGQGTAALRALGLG